MTKTVSFEDLPTLAGQEIGVSDWVAIDQDRINKFADATGDHQWIHVDVERAKKEMPGGKTIAHGYLTLVAHPHGWRGGLMRIDGRHARHQLRLQQGALHQHGAGGKPRPRARRSCCPPSRKSGGMQLISEVTIEIEGQQRPACVAETIGIVFK